MGSNGADAPPAAPDLTPSREAFSRNDSRSRLQSTLSYIWTTRDSMFSRDVDRWIGGDTGSPNNPVLPPRTTHTRIITAGPHTFSQTPLPSSGFWYVAAMVLPLLNLNVCRNWRCTPSALLNTAELVLSQVSAYYSRVRMRVRRMTQEGARDLFAGAMDLVLFVYAVGFLILSLYQASVFQQI